MASNYAESCTSSLSTLGQCLVQLQPSNAEALLQAASREIHQRRSEAEAILAQLQRLNAAVASRFKLKQDFLTGLHLRLISSPTEEQQTPTSFDAFITVSYCWHSPEWQLAAAAQPVAPGWDVSVPMVDAVMAMRESPREGVWLDKLCINQSDDQDKVAHIGTMDIIYRTARRIVILLEDVQLTEEEESAGLAYAEIYKDLGKEIDERGIPLQDRVRYMDAYFHSRGESSKFQNLQEKAYRFCMKMLNARWFSRAWCVHESRVSPHTKVNNPLFFCYAADGRVLSFEFRVVQYLAMFIKDIVEVPAALHGVDMRSALKDPNPQTLEQRWWRMVRLMPELSDRETTSALQHIVSTLQFECRYKADLMSIALNTAGIPLAFDGDVATTEDVIWMFMMLVLAGDDVTPLFVDGDKLRVPAGDASGSSTISWAVYPQHGNIDERTRSPRLDTITGTTRDYIELDLIVFESLPTSASMESFKVATKVMEQFGLVTHVQEAANDRVKWTYENITSHVDRGRSDLQQATGATLGPGPLKQFIPMWLGHALDCGLEWTLRFPDVMQAATQDWPSYGVLGEATDGRLAGAARSLLDHFTSQAGTPAVERDHDRDVQGLTRFLTCVLDHRLSLFTIQPRRLSLGNGDFAFTTSAANRTWIAVPAASAHAQAWKKRAWVLEAFDPSSEGLEESPQSHLPDINMALRGDESAEDVFPVLPSDFADKRRARGEAWRLRRMEEIFGCQPLSGTESVAVSGHVAYLKSQRVYGAESFNWGAIFRAVTEFEKKHGPKPSSLLRGKTV